MINSNQYVGILDKLAGEFVEDAVMDEMERTAGVRDFVKNVSGKNLKNAIGARKRVVTDTHAAGGMGIDGAMRKATDDMLKANVATRAARKKVKAVGAGVAGAGAIGGGAYAAMKSRKQEKEAFEYEEEMEMLAAAEEAVGEALATFEEASIMKEAAEEAFEMADQYEEADFIKQAAAEAYDEADFYMDAATEVLDAYGLLD
ncbi:MAG: hypothetical protein RR420_01185 [Anaerovoracaceae bacterium]